jgi:hypothetical protein
VSFTVVGFMLELLCSATLTVLIFSEKLKRWRPAMFPLQHWTIIIKLIIKFINSSEWRTWNHRCVTTTLLVSVKNNTVSMRCFRVFLCQLSCAKWRMSRNNATLAGSGRIRTNLHDLLCYYVTEHRSLHGWIINTKSNNGSFRAPLCTTNLLCKANLYDTATNCFSLPKWKEHHELLQEYPIYHKWDLRCL